ncbi:MAG: hypothetical protein CSA58_08445 [Micrococcales bacterium]|nr:MAG: hypothetical protein CSB46_06475 [Micrococcales bacterium]PIE26633.1 MAG: hypothetical protein CSA58_08445 [Micrococcales bacterium]
MNDNRVPVHAAGATAMQPGTAVFFPTLLGTIGLLALTTTIAGGHAGRLQDPNRGHVLVAVALLTAVGYLGWPGQPDCTGS